MKYNSFIELPIDMQPELDPDVLGRMMTYRWLRKSRQMQERRWRRLYGRE